MAPARPGAERGEPDGKPGVRLAPRSPRSSAAAAVAPAQQARRAPQEQHVVRECWRLFLRNLPLALIGNTASALLFGGLLWWHRGGWEGPAWVGAMLAINGWRWLEARRRRFQVLSRRRHATACRIMVAGNIAGGLGWGLGFVGLLPWGEMGLQVLACFFAAGLSAGAISALTPVYRAFAVFVVAMNGPLALYLAAHTVLPQAAMALGAVVFTGVLLVIGRNVNRQISDGLAIRFANVSLMRELARARDRAEQLSRAKSEFLATMSHELRTPLNAVLGFSQSIEAQIFGPLGDERYADYARDIRESGEHLLALIDDVLDLSRIGAGRYDLRVAPCDVDELARSAARTLAQAAQAGGVRLDLADMSGLPGISADARALKQMLLNLISNAVKFTPSGGWVAVGAEILDTESLRIFVRDTGIGIASAEQQRVLRPFEQVDSSLARRYQGTGLGLSLAKELAELHGGRLELESAMGEGTTVSLILPGLLPTRQGTRKGHAPAVSG